MKLVLGPLEEEIMKILWDKNRCDARTVFEELRKERNIAYTTVSTVLNRLSQKGFLKKEMDDKSRRYIYTITRTRDQYERNVVRKTLESLIRKFGESTVNYLAENLAENEEEIDILKKKLNEMMKDVE